MSVFATPAHQPSLPLTPTTRPPKRPAARRAVAQDGLDPWPVRLGKAAVPGVAAGLAVNRVARALPPDTTALRALATHAAPWFGPHTLLGAHPLLTTAGGVVGVIAGGAAAVQVYEALPPAARRQIDATLKRLRQACERAAPYLSSAALGALSLATAQESMACLGEAHHVAAALLLLVALPSGLGGLQVFGEHFKLPLVDRALDGPLQFLMRHDGDVLGALLGGAGVGAAMFAQSMLAASHFWGLPLLISSLPATLGGVEMIGREHDVPVLKECLTTPLRKIGEALRYLLHADLAWTALGLALGAAGTLGAARGVQHLLQPSSSLADALGALEFTAGSAATALGAGIVGHRLGKLRTAPQLLEDYLQLIGGSALLSWGAAAGKFSAASLGAAGMGYTNSAAGALAASTVGFGILTIMSQWYSAAALERAAYRVISTPLACGSAAWTLLLVRSMGQSLTAPGGVSVAALLNTAPQGAAAAACLAATLGFAGSATQRTWLKNAAWRTCTRVGDGVDQVTTFAAKRPWVTLAMLGAAVLAAGRGLR